MGADSQFDQNFDTCRGKRPLSGIQPALPAIPTRLRTLTPSPEQYEDCSKTLKLVKAPNEMLDN